MDKIATVDEFVEKKVLPEFHPVVAMIRSLTREFAPKAREMISYGIPANKVKRMIAVISPTKKIKRMAGANMDALLISLLDDVLFFFFTTEKAHLPWQAVPGQIPWILSAISALSAVNSLAGAQAGNYQESPPAGNVL